MSNHRIEVLEARIATLEKIVETLTAQVAKKSSSSRKKAKGAEA